MLSIDERKQLLADAMCAAAGDLHLGERRRREKWLKAPEDPGEGRGYVDEQLVREELGVVVREDVRDLAGGCL